MLFGVSFILQKNIACIESFKNRQIGIISEYLFPLEESSFTMPVFSVDFSISEAVTAVIEAPGGDKGTISVPATVKKKNIYIQNN